MIFSDNRKCSLGSWITFPCDATAEIMASAGFDWLVLDMEHAPLGLESAARLIRIIDLKGVPVLCRLPGHHPELIKNVLDAGASGIIVPSVESAEQAQHIVQSAHYPPVGFRGVGLGRAHEYGAGFENYRKSKASNLTVIAMIETKKGVEAVESIASTPGINGLLIGPYDLSGSLGVIGKLDDPLLNQAKKTVIQTAKKFSVPVGLHVVHPKAEQISSALNEGYQFLALGVDMIYLDQAAKQSLSQAKALT